MSDLEQAIEAVDKLRQSPHYKELADYEPPFNPFEIVGATHRELIHSSVLAWLLRDEANKEFRQKFVDKIATDKPELGLSVSDGPGNSRLKPKEVKPEYSFEASDEAGADFVAFGAGRFDVFVHFESLELVIGIEVKVNAGERPEQVEKYQNFLCKEYSSYKKVIVFLTPEGYPSTTKSIHSKALVLEISWGHIVRMIREMRATLGKENDFRMQFLQHLERNIAKNKIEEQRIVHALLSEGEGDNLEIIRNITNEMSQEEIEKEEVVHKIIENRPSLQTSLECEFWRELESQLEYKNLEFQSYYDGLDGPRMEVIENEKLEECIRWRAGSLGLIFSIPDRFSIPNSSLYDNHEVVCRITRDDDSHIYYGFVLCEKKGNLRKRVVINGENHEKYLDLYGRIDLDHGPDEDGKHGWLGWKEKAKVRIYFANNRKPQLFDTLVKMKKDKGNVVKELVCEIYKFIDEKYAKLLTIYPE